MTLTWYQQKGHVTKYTHVKYECPNSYQSKDMANVKVLVDKQRNRQRDIQKLFVPDLSKLGHEMPFEGNKPPSFMTCHIWFITALVFGKFIDGYSLIWV